MDRPTTDAIEQACPSVATWAERPTEADLKPIPGCPAVLLFVDVDGRPIQLLTTQQLRRAVTARLAADEAPSKRADVGAVARGVRWRATSCPFESRWWYYQLARRLYPKDYRTRVSFGPAWFLFVDWRAPVIDIRTSERVWALDGDWIGPWPTQREAQQALEGLWDLFDLCRHPEQVRQAPRGNRCAYAEMGRCDAPCDGSVPLEPYHERVRAAWRFAQGEIEPWIASASHRMREAAAAQRFETAAQIKQQLVFATRWRREWSSVGPLARLEMLLAIPASRRKAWKLFVFAAGELIDGPLVADRKVLAASVEFARYAAVQSAASEPQVRTEQTWLLCHHLLGPHRDASAVVPLGTARDETDGSGRIAAALEAARAAAGSAPTEEDTLATG